MKIPTDLEILEIIYKTYYEEFSNFNRQEENGRQSKPYVPINCEFVGQRLGVDKDIIFGRLYNHLDKVYGYVNSDNGSKVHLFALKVGNDVKCVHFPLLASVLAGLQEDNRRFKITTWISIIALLVSGVALGVSLFFGRP